MTCCGQNWSDRGVNGLFTLLSVDCPHVVTCDVHRYRKRHRTLRPATAGRPCPNAAGKRATRSRHERTAAARNSRAAIRRNETTCQRIGQSARAAAAQPAARVAAQPQRVAAIAVSATAAYPDGTPDIQRKVMFGLDPRCVKGHVHLYVIVCPANSRGR